MFHCVILTKLILRCKRERKKDRIGNIEILLSTACGSLNSGTKCHCMEFNWPPGFSKLFFEKCPCSFYFSSRRLLSSSPSYYLSPLLSPSFFFFFYFPHSISALSTNISCQSIPSEISNGIDPSDNITRRFCIFHRTLTIRIAMKLSSTDRYTRVDAEKKLVGTWPGGR